MQTAGAADGCSRLAERFRGGGDELGGLAGVREIVVLASRGLTNGEIADRLYLSPRTVASHLYRSYPKLGIAGRHQLAALIARSGADPGAGL